MTELVYQFKSIKRIIDRQEQKADFEAKNPKVEQSAYDSLTGGMFGIGAPLNLPDIRGRVFTGVQTGGTSAPIDQMGSSHAGRLTGGSCETKTLVVADLPSYTPSLKSMAHPEWPYAGTGFEWAKFVKVKI